MKQEINFKNTELNIFIFLLEKSSEINPSHMLRKRKSGDYSYHFELEINQIVNELFISKWTIFRCIKKLEKYGLIKKYRSHKTFFYMNYELIDKLNINIDNKYNNKNIIKSISYNQNEILYNIMMLYNDGKPFELDPTYSIGGFYEKSKEFVIEQPEIKLDVYPCVKNVIKIEPFSSWNIHDNSVRSIIFDLPFIISTGKSLEEEFDPMKKNNLIYRRFSAYSSKLELFKSYTHFMKESFRVLKDNGILVVKCQKCVTCGNVVFVPEFVFHTAVQIGFIPIDRFTLLSRNRMISQKMIRQIHSRSFDSQLYVFRKTTSE